MFGFYCSILCELFNVETFSFRARAAADTDAGHCILISGERIRGRKRAAIRINALASRQRSARNSSPRNTVNLID